MPTYQYACTACDERLEAVQSFTDAPLTECPACGGTLRKVFSAVGVVFKGSGFYKTDSRGARRADGKADAKTDDQGRLAARPTAAAATRPPRRTSSGGSKDGSSSAASTSSSLGARRARAPEPPVDDAAAPPSSVAPGPRVALLTQEVRRVADDVAEIGVIGGSGLYALLEDAREVEVDTPYGAAERTRSSSATCGGRSVAFLPRHGRDHSYPPHRIPYRANLWALRSLGVRQVLAPCAVGGLRPELGPGSLVVPDQLVDRTSGPGADLLRPRRGPRPVRRPVLPGRAGRSALRRRRAAGWPVTDGGTMVVVEGPRFSTRAESRWFPAQGWSVVNMTGHPEAVLARELALCYTAVALVTDLDAGVEEGQAVTQEEVFRVFRDNTARLRDAAARRRRRAARRAATAAPARHALDGLTPTPPCRDGRRRGGAARPAPGAVAPPRPAGGRAGRRVGGDRRDGARAGRGARPRPSWSPPAT